MPASTRQGNLGIKRWSLSRLQKRRIDFDLFFSGRVNGIGEAGQSILAY
jgi:hypothetical protein